jgi:hypothetical protein
MLQGTDFMRTCSTFTFCRAAIVLAAALLFGCSGIKTYPNTLEKNLLIRTSAESKAFLEKVRVAIDIYEVDEECRTEYKGTVKLGKATEVGIPPGRTSYLAFKFKRSNFLARSKSSITEETMLKPRAGHKYDVEVSYKDYIYNVVIKESVQSGSGWREVEIRDFSHCKAVK